MKLTLTSTFVALLALAGSSSAHCLISRVEGANGVVGRGLNVPEITSHDVAFKHSTRFDPKFDNRCGAQKLNGAASNPIPIDDNAKIAESTKLGLPTPAADGTLKMTIRVVTEDGGGPFECELSPIPPFAFKKVDVITNVPGERGGIKARDKDFELSVKIPP